MKRDWLPPEPPRGSPAWFLASIAVHVLVVLSLLLISGRTRQLGVSYILLDGTPIGPVVQYDMPYFPGGGGQGGVEGGTGVARPRSAPAAPGVGTPGQGPPGLEPPVVVGPPAPAERGGLGVAPGRRILGARLGDGRVWVRPWDALAAAIAGMGEDESDTAAHIARIDSVVAVRIMAFLDTLSPDSMALPMLKPWVTEIGGQKWGIDGGWIYLGGIKLPSAILALLPLPQGNYEQAQHDGDLQRIREDILQAGRRAESAAEFKHYVEETRKRRDAEREAKKNQRVKPDSIKA